MSDAASIDPSGKAVKAVKAVPSVPGALSPGAARVRRAGEAGGGGGDNRFAGAPGDGEHLLGRQAEPRALPGAAGVGGAQDAAVEGGGEGGAVLGDVRREADGRDGADAAGN